MKIKSKFLMYSCLAMITSMPICAQRTRKARNTAVKEEKIFEAKEHALSHGEVVKPSKPLYPPTATDIKDDMIEVNLENTDLTNVLAWVEDMYKVNFLTDDSIQPPPANGKLITGKKINFKTNVPMTKKQVWDLFITFLDLLGFALTEGSIPNFYRVRSTAFDSPNTINRSPLNSYINVHWEDLPDNDMRIRYVYFVRNSTLETIRSIVEAFRSQTATLQTYQDLNAFILTDKSSNIRSIMTIIEELDIISMPEAMSVLKLKNADATEVANLYKTLTGSSDQQSLAARILGTKKQPTAVYFPDTLRVIPETRTNTLIILGDKDGIKKVEEFIINYVDVALKVPYSPLYVYELQYTNAVDIATILTAVTQFASSSEAAKSGGVREGDKYLQPMTFTAEPEGNRILIRAEKEDYLKVRKILKQLDVKQPQVAIEVLIISVLNTDDRELGIQIRNKDRETINRNINFQNSGFPLGGSSFSSPIVDDTTGSLLGSLIKLAEGQSPGSTLISIGNNITGVWGMFKVLQERVHASVVANPFLITTNTYPAQIAIGETRYVATAQVAGTKNVTGFGEVSANLSVKITPHINAIGIINLEVEISIDNFSNVADPTSANKDTKTIKTIADVGNSQVLALGGLLKTNHNESLYKVPLLGDIPLLGWLFKSKAKSIEKNNLLVFIAPRVVEPLAQGGITEHTKEKINFAKSDMNIMYTPAEKRDPLHRWFFQDSPCENTEYIDNFIKKQNPELCIDVPASLYCPPPCPESCINTQPVHKNRSIIDLLPSQHDEVVA